MLLVHFRTMRVTPVGGLPARLFLAGLHIARKYVVADVIRSGFAACHFEDWFADRCAVLAVNVMKIGR